MNKGIMRATGEYLLFLNSGDYLYDSTVLEDVTSTLSGEDIIYGDLLYVENGVEREVCVYPTTLNLDYFFEHSLGHPATFIKRSLFQDSLYSEDLKIVSDWEFFLKKIVLEEVSYRHISLSLIHILPVDYKELGLKRYIRLWKLQHFLPWYIFSLRLSQLFVFKKRNKKMCYE